jgi:hypothetical protein
MIAFILSALFPPRADKLGAVPGTLVLHAIQSGALETINHDDTWAGNVREWSNGRWNLKVHPTTLLSAGYKRDHSRYGLQFSSELPRGDFWLRTHELRSAPFSVDSQ